MMPYEGSYQTIQSVLSRLGIDPRERMDELDQDPEYTACRSEEIPSYFRLYTEGVLDADERAVLCCFLLEGLNERIQTGAPHPLQEDILTTLFAAGEIHAAELAYWMDSSDPDEENWWPITTALLHHRDRSSRAR
jgi:hypothetical protein